MTMGLQALRGGPRENSGTLVPLLERFPVLALEVGLASSLSDLDPFYTIFSQRNKRLMLVRPAHAIQLVEITLAERLNSVISDARKCLFASKHSHDVEYGWRDGPSGQRRSQRLGHLSELNALGFRESAHCVL